LKLTLSGSDNLTLTAFCDADWGSDSDRKSTTGFLIFLGNSLIAWTSKKQNSVAMSTMEAEFLALSSCTQEILYLRSLLTELYIPQDHPTTMYQDNQSCIQFATSGQVSQRSKHIDIRNHLSLIKSQEETFNSFMMFQPRLCLQMPSPNQLPVKYSDS
jgi:hypothetical protein